MQPHLVEILSPEGDVIYALVCYVPVAEPDCGQHNIEKERFTLAPGSEISVYGCFITLHLG